MNHCFDVLNHFDNQTFINSALYCWWRQKREYACCVTVSAIAWWCGAVSHSELLAGSSVLPVGPRHASRYLCWTRKHQVIRRLGHHMNCTLVIKMQYTSCDPFFRPSDMDMRLILFWQLCASDELINSPFCSVLISPLTISQVSPKPI